LPDNVIRVEGTALQDKSPSRRSGLLADYLPEKDLAAELDVTVRTLARWRELRIGPPYVTRGREIEYPITAARSWLAAGGTSGKSSRRRNRPAPPRAGSQTISNSRCARCPRERESSGKTFRG
jgi:hypothetical protein